MADDLMIKPLVASHVPLTCVYIFVACTRCCPAEIFLYSLLFFPSIASFSLRFYPLLFSIPCSIYSFPTSYPSLSPHPSGFYISSTWRFFSFSLFFLRFYKMFLSIKTIACSQLLLLTSNFIVQSRKVLYF